MQENLFPAYFDQCPIVYVSGRTFPITTHYIEEVHKVVAQGQRLTAIERGTREMFCLCCLAFVLKCLVCSKYGDQYALQTVILRKYGYINRLNLFRCNFVLQSMQLFLNIQDHYLAQVKFQPLATTM